MEDEGKDAPKIMHHTIINESFISRYSLHIQAFADAIREIDTAGIPEPHLPHWGTLYEAAPIRVWIIGRDTRSWGKMPGFLEAVRQDCEAALFRGKEEFDGLDLTEWTNNYGKTFWDTAMKILSGVHGVDDWKRLKRREVEGSIA